MKCVFGVETMILETLTEFNTLSESGGSASKGKEAMLNNVTASTLGKIKLSFGSCFVFLARLVTMLRLLRRYTVLYVLLFQCKNCRHIELLITQYRCGHWQ